jgi:hypothetical protein
LSFISFFVYPGEENTTDSKHSALINLDFLNFTVIVKKIGKKKPFCSHSYMGCGGVGVRFKG